MEGDPGDHGGLVYIILSYYRDLRLWKGTLEIRRTCIHNIIILQGSETMEGDPGDHGGLVYII